MDIVNLDHLSSVYDSNLSKAPSQAFSKAANNNKMNKGSIIGGFSLGKAYSLSGITQPVEPQAFHFPSLLGYAIPDPTSDFSEYFCYGSCPVSKGDTPPYLYSNMDTPTVMAVAGRKQLNGGIFSFGYSSIRT